MKNHILVSDSYSPLYKQLIQKLRNDIASGLYPVNSRIPSEQELCQTYRVSRVTVRKALLDLTQEGLLKRHQGKGTFVSIPRIQKDLLEITSFHSACQLMGATPSTKVLHSTIKNADAQDIAQLHLATDDKVIEIFRIRLADDEPVMLENNHFPIQYEYLLQEDLSASLYQALSNHQVEPTQAVHDISLCYATQGQAKHLGLEAGAALLQLFEVIFDQNGLPLHTSHQFIRGDRFTFRI